MEEVNLEDIIFKSVKQCFKYQVLTPEEESYSRLLHNYVYTDIFKPQEIAYDVKKEIINSFRTEINPKLSQEEKNYKNYRAMFLGFSIAGVIFGNPLMFIIHGAGFAFCQWKITSLKSDKGVVNPLSNDYEKIPIEKWTVALENLKPKIKETIEKHKAGM